jgi:AcrR family transcriptional regulator
VRSSSSPVLPAIDTNAPLVVRGEELSSPRRRLVGAVAALAPERGPRRLTVARICKQAGIPQDAFYDAFPDAEECFSVTVEDALEQLWSIIESEVGRTNGRWSERVAVAVSTFLAALDADPGRAWLCVVEPLGDSRRAGHARTALKDRMVALLEDDGQPASDGSLQPRTVAVGTVGSLWELAVQHVTGRGEDLSIDEIAGSVTFLALAPRLGRTEAMQRVFSAPKPSELTIVWPADEWSDDD